MSDFLLRIDIKFTAGDDPSAREKIKQMEEAVAPIIVYAVKNNLRVSSKLQRLQEGGPPVSVNISQTALPKTLKLRGPECSSTKE